MPRVSSYRGHRAFTGTPAWVELFPLAARTTAGSPHDSPASTGWHSAAVAGATPQARLTITAFGGTTPTLDVVIQDSPDGTTWTTRDTFPQQTGVATVTRSLPTTLAANVRARATVAGAGGTFTFRVQLALRTDLLA
jgi:hypothetical protein